MSPIRPRLPRVLADAVVLLAAATAAAALLPVATAAVPTTALLETATAHSGGTAPDLVSAALPRPPVGAGQRSVTVAVGGGVLQAAVHDERGHVTFWSRSAVSHVWARVGSSAYPVLSPSSGPRIRQALGVLPTGMHDAVFILRGYFTGDGDADDLAFATGPHGWGQLAPTGTTLVSTGRGATTPGAAGLALHIQLSQGMLETSQGSDVVTVAQAALIPVNRFYRWDGHALVRDHDNILNAVRSRGPSPARAITALPNCAVVRSDGVYDAPEDARSGPPATPFAINNGVPVTVRLFARNGRVCSFTVPASRPVSVPVTVAGRLTRWITAPVWVLTTTGSLGDPWGDLQGATESPSVTMASFVPRGAATWFVPPWLHVRALAPTGVESPVASAVVQVRFRGGHLVALTVFRNSISSD